LPPAFSQDGGSAGVILANATPPKDIVNAIMSAATNNVTRFLISLTSFHYYPKGKPAHLSVRR
jgi:hypothetical protein